MPNGINRYGVPAQQPLMQTYVPIPYKELLMAGAQQQKQFEDVEARRLALGELDLPALTQDIPGAKDILGYYENEIDKISDLYPKDMRQARAEVKKLERQAKKDFGRYGRAGAIKANYATRQKFSEDLKKRIGKSSAQGGISQQQYDKTMSYLDTLYKGVGEGRSGIYSAYPTEEVAKYVDFTNFANTYGKDIKADIKSTAASIIGGDGYIRDFDHALEVVGKDRVRNILWNYASGSDELMNYLQQGEQIGYTSLENLMSAIEGASTKYSYQQEEESADTKTDGTWKYINETLMKESPESFGNIATTTFEDLGGGFYEHKTKYNATEEALKTLTDREEFIKNELLKNNYRDPNKKLNPVLTQEYKDELSGLAIQKIQYNHKLEQLTELNKFASTKALKDLNLSEQDIALAKEAKEVVFAMNKEVKMDPRIKELENFLGKEIKTYSELQTALGTARSFFPPAVVEKVIPPAVRALEDIQNRNITDNITTYRRGELLIPNLIDYNKEVSKTIDNYYSGSRDYTEYQLTSEDIENVRAFRDTKEYIFNNPDNYDFKVIGPDGKLKTISPSEIQKEHDAYTASQIVSKKNYDDKEKERFMKNYAGDELNNDDITFKSIIADADYSVRLQTPSGLQVRVTPKGSNEEKESHRMRLLKGMNSLSGRTKLVNTVTGQNIVGKVRNPVANEFSTRLANPTLLNKVLNVEEELRNIVPEANQVITVTPIKLGNDKYLHMGRSGSEGTVVSWVNDSNDKSNLPEENEAVTIPMEYISNIVFNSYIE